MPQSENLSRRQFMERTAVTSTAVAAPYFVSARALGAEDKTPANERLRVGLIGCGGMGQSNLSNCAAQADVEVTALCDM